MESNTSILFYLFSSNILCLADITPSKTKEKRNIVYLVIMISRCICHVH